MVRIEHRQNGEIVITANGMPVRLPPPGQVIVVIPRTEYKSYKTSTEESRKNAHT